MYNGTMNMNNKNSPLTTHHSPLISGFTLIELLVSVALFSIIASVGTEVLVLSLRNRTKADFTREVKQNGDYISTVIQSMIRNGTDLEGTCNVNGTSATVRNPDGFTTVFECTGNKIASHSAGFPDPQPTVTYNLTTDEVYVNNCSFRIVCPSPAAPKYLYVNFKIGNQQGAGIHIPQERMVSIDYQSTTRIRSWVR